MTRALASLLVTYVLLELVLVPVALRESTLGRLVCFPPPMRVLAQTSKSHLVPEDYLLVVGDSYAEGHGDWLRSAAPHARPEYSSVHVLHDLLCEDVITFGRGGAGSVQGFVTLPVRTFLSLRRYSLRRPRTVLAYVYEGNDLNDNLADLRDQYAGGIDAARSADDAALDAFLEQQARAARFEGWRDNVWYAPPLLEKMLRKAGEGLAGEPDEEESEAWLEGPTRAWIGGAVVPLPDALQSPALELTAEEFDAALRVTERSLLFLSRTFPDVEVFVVLLPSPLATYRLDSPVVTIQTYEGRAATYAAAEVAERHGAIRDRLEGFAREHGFGFIDPLSDLRAAAEREALHGPLDWKHFNRAGYTALAQSIAENLRTDR